MAFETCMFCWKRKATEGFGVGKGRVCKGCAYEIGRTVSFLEYNGYRLQAIALAPELVNRSLRKKPKIARKAKVEGNGSGSTPAMDKTSPVLPGEG